MNEHVAEQIFIIGSMKCGTSTLYAYLAEHPEICPPVIKEPEYFSSKLGQARYKSGEFWDLFELDPVKHRFVLDASTGYTKFPTEQGVARRISEYGLRPKLIYVVRDPVERIRSHYNFMQRDLKWRLDIESTHLVDVSNYYLQLEQYAEYFPRENLLIVDFRELVSDPKKVLKSVFAFLGIEPVYPEQGLVANQTKPVNRQELRIRSILRRRASWLPEAARERIGSVAGHVLPKKQRQLSESEEAKVRELLRGDMLRFGDTYGFDVSQWGFGRTA